MLKLIAVLSTGAILLYAAALHADDDDDDGAKRPKLVTVHCDSGSNKTISKALGKGKKQELIVEFDGTCVEDVAVERGNLTIRGLSPTATIQGAVRVANVGPSAGSARPGPVALENFTIIFSPGDGLTVGAGKVVTARGLVTQQNSANGIHVFGGGWLRCIDCSSFSNAGDGILVISNGTAEIAGGSDFFSNVEAGISVGSSGEVGLFSREPGAPAVADISANTNGQDGIQVFDGGTLLSAGFTTIVANGNGVSGFGSGILVGTGAAGLISGQITTDGNDAGVFSVAGKLLFFGDVSATGNTFGLFALNNGTLRLIGANNNLNDNAQGARVDGSFLQLLNTSFSGNGADVALLFGAKARLANAAPGIVLCDGTELISGAICTP